MTDLNKRVARRTFATKRERSKTRRIIVSLEPGDVLGFRLERTRMTYHVSVEGAYDWAAQCYADAIRRERKMKKKKGK
jgi:hypothetical protein